GYEEHINFLIFEAEFDQFNSQILDPHSEMYRSGSEYVVLYLAAEKLWIRFAASEPRSRETFAAQILSDLETWWKAIAERSQAKVIQFNFVEINDGIFGHFAARVRASFVYQIKKLNFELMNLAQEQKHVFIADVAGLSNQAGYSTAHDARFYATSQVAFALDFLPAVAKAVTDIVKAIGGSIKKCLVLD